VSAWRIVIQPVAVRMLQNIKDRRVRTKIMERIDALAENPEKQGKPLLGELAGLRSVRAVGRRYRIIYGVHEDEVLVHVLALGIRKEGDRKDIHQLARRLIGHLGNNKEEPQPE